MSTRTHAAGMIGIIVGAMLGAAAMVVAPPTTTPLPGGQTSPVQLTTHADKGKRFGYVKRPRVGRAVTHSGKRLNFNRRKDGCVLVPYVDITTEHVGDPGDGEWYCPR